jgi:hypothetical protein
MKGIVFCELIDMVEAGHGLEVVEEMLEKVCPASQGSYSRVGTYDHRELVAYVGFLSERTGLPVAALQRAFGHHLMRRFVTDYSQFFVEPRNTFEFLATIDSTIHVEVRKLHADAELPRFSCAMRGSDSMELIYQSKRPFADLAHGLIEAAAQHYGETIAIERQDRSAEGETVVHFHLRRAA